MTMGLKQDNFDEKVPNEFLCSHCHDVFLEPVCLDCLHILCSTCFKKRMKRKSKTCSVCGKGLSLSDKEIEPVWRGRYASLKIACTKGCEKAVALGSLNDHLANHCPLAFTPCTNLGCTRKVRRRDLPLHLKQCDFRLVNCEGCGFRTKYSNLRMHQIVQKCLFKSNLHMIVQNRREMDSRVKEHRLKLKEETFQIELQERDLDRNKMWSAIARNNISRTTTPSPPRRFSPVLSHNEEKSSTRMVHSAPASPATSRGHADCKLCANCNKLFTERRNHGEACRWHRGVSVWRNLGDQSFVVSYVM